MAVGETELMESGKTRGDERGPYGEAVMSTRHKRSLWKESKLQDNGSPLGQPQLLHPESGSQTEP